MSRAWQLVTLLILYSSNYGLTDASLGNKRNYYKAGVDVIRTSNLTSSDPPPHELVAKMARYIVHTSGKYL